MNNYWAFAQMRASDDLLGDSEALQARMDKDGYLYLRGVVDRERVAAVRTSILSVLARHGWIASGDDLDLGLAVGRPVRESEEAYFAVYDEIQRLEAFHTLAHHESLVRVMRQVLGDTAFPHPMKVARLVFPSNPEVSTPPHQDFRNNQGTSGLTAAWIPLGPCPMEMGSLAILPGSHRFGILPREFHLGPGNRQVILSREMRESRHWVTTDMAAGDVVLFGALTVHAALHNATPAMRVSVDYRYQREHEPLTDRVLQPHFGRLTWDQVYADWQSHEYQYYWQSLEYDTVPFDRGEVLAAIPSAAEIRSVAAYEQTRDARYQAQLEVRTRSFPPDSRRANPP